MPVWKVKGQEIDNCTKENIPLEDLTKPCELFAKELRFNKVLNQRLRKNSSEAMYRLYDINKLSNRQRAPIEIIIKECQKIKLEDFMFWSRLKKTLAKHN